MSKIFSKGTLNSVQTVHHCGHDVSLKLTDVQTTEPPEPTEGPEPTEAAPVAEVTTADTEGATKGVKKGTKKEKGGSKRTRTP